MPVLIRVSIIGLTLALVACNGADDSAGRSTPALAVATTPLAAGSGYRAVTWYAGRVEAGRTSQLGFEVPGQVAAIAVDEGDAVKAGDELATLDRSRLAAQRAEASAAVAAADADLALAVQTLARIRDARGYDGVSAQELDQAEQRAAAAAAAKDAAAAVVRRIDVELAKSVLRAPYAGTIVRRSADDGQIVAAGQLVVTIQEDAAQEVRIGLGGELPASLSAGSPVQLRINGRDVEAQVRAIVPARNTRTRTIDVIFDLDETAVVPGDIARLAVERHIAAEGYWLPLSSLTEGRRGLWSLYVASPLASDEETTGGATHRIESRPMEVLYQAEGQVYASGSAREGELAVVDGLQRVVPGQQVRLATPGGQGDLAGGSNGQAR